MAWQDVLKEDLPFPHFYLFLGQGLGIPVDLYATNAQHYLPKGDGLGYIWANALQLLEWMFPDRNWTEEEIKTLSTNLYGRFFNITRCCLGSTDKVEIQVEIGLIRIASRDEGFRQEYCGDGILLPVSKLSIDMLVNNVVTTFGLTYIDPATIFNHLTEITAVTARLRIEIEKLRSQALQETKNFQLLQTANTKEINRLYRQSTQRFNLLVIISVLFIALIIDKIIF